MMKYALPLVMLLVAAATAASVSNNLDLVDAPEMIVSYEDVDLTDLSDLDEGADQNEALTEAYILLARITSTAGAIHSPDITFRTKGDFVISKIRVNVIGDSEGAAATIISGGVGYTYVTIRLSQTDSNYYYQIEIYGRKIAVTDTS